MPRKPDPFIAQLVAWLGPLGDVTARAMFGGYGLYCDGLMIGIVDEQSFYIKVDDLSREECAAAGMTPFTYQRLGRPVTMNFCRVVAADLADPERLQYWGRLGLAAARRAKRR